jgi:hypothetical protein
MIGFPSLCYLKKIQTLSFTTNNLKKIKKERRCLNIVKSLGYHPFLVMTVLDYATESGHLALLSYKNPTPNYSKEKEP